MNDIFFSLYHRRVQLVLVKKNLPSVQGHLPFFHVKASYSKSSVAVQRDTSENFFCTRSRAQQRKLVDVLQTGKSDKRGRQEKLVKGNLFGCTVQTPDIGNVH